MKSHGVLTELGGYVCNFKYARDLPKVPEHRLEIFLIDLYVHAKRVCQMFLL